VRPLHPPRGGETFSLFLTNNTEAKNDHQWQKGGRDYRKKINLPYSAKEKPGPPRSQSQVGKGRGGKEEGRKWELTQPSMRVATTRRDFAKNQNQSGEGESHHVASSEGDSLWGFYSLKKGRR